MSERIKLLITLPAVAIIILGFYSWQNSWQKTEQQASVKQEAVVTPNPLSDWKTYTNTEYGFEVKYPPEEIISPPNDTVILEKNLGKKIISLDTINSKEGFTCIEGEDIRCTNVSVGDRTAVVQYSMAGYINASIDLFNGTSIYASLSCDSFGSNPNLVEGYCIVSNQRQEMFIEFLSTFKFIDPQVYTSNWQIYRDDELKIEFKYPVGWEVASLAQYNINSVIIRNPTDEYPQSIAMSIDKNTTVEQVTSTLSIGELISQNKKSYQESEWSVFVYDSSVEPVRNMVALSQYGKDVIRFGATGNFSVMEKMISTFKFNK